MYPFRVSKFMTGGAKHEKYFFEERLEEGILYVKSGILTAAVSGAKYNAVFPPGRTPKNVQRNKIPCLARRYSSAEGGCIVEAVSADSMETEKKEWICMNPSLFKNAAGFFFGKAMLWRK